MTMGIIRLFMPIKQWEIIHGILLHFQIPNLKPTKLSKAEIVVWKCCSVGFIPLTLMKIEEGFGSTTGELYTMRCSHYYIRDICESRAPGVVVVFAPLRCQMLIKVCWKLDHAKGKKLGVYNDETFHSGMYKKLELLLTWNAPCLFPWLVFKDASISAAPITSHYFVGAFHRDYYSC